MTPITGDVLIVDGDESIRHLLEVVVRMLPRRPVVAANGRDALEMLRSRSFDAILIDLILPEVSGQIVLEWIGRHDPALLSQVVVVTTEPESQWRRCRETRSVAAVIRKPFSIEELQSVLRGCCARANGNV